MAVLALYLTHPQVRIDPAVPVPSWGLSALGRARTEALANIGCLFITTKIISSGEQKAIETAEIIAGKLNIDVEVR
jgi:broad specificity phosphatase PhoE